MQGKPEWVIKKDNEDFEKMHMQKTVRWVISALIFVLIGLFLFGGISNVLRKKTGDLTDMVHSFYSIEENTLDVLCMGSSHAYSSFQPNTLWKEYGITSYVMGSHRQTVATTYYLLKEALNYQKPKVLLLEAYYFHSLEKYVDEPSLRFAFDGIRLGKAKHEMISDLLCDLPWKDKVSFYIPFIKYHSRWNELKNQDFVSRTYLKGSILDFEVQKMKEPEIPVIGCPLPEYSVLYFQKIMDLCRENGIQVVLYSAPYNYNEESYEGVIWRQQINFALKPYCEELGIPYLDYQRMEDISFNYKKDFRDYSHMNTRGAEKLTGHLGAYLVDNYEWTDHREDPAYESWNQDYQKYAAVIEEKRK